jgi:hypothetical protein
VEIFIASFAALLLEISYTRVISFKLFYYYTYFVIGLALLGIGSGGVIVTLSRRVRSASTDTIVKWSLALGATSIALGYLVVAYTKLDTFAIWQYGTEGSVTNVARLLGICLALSAPFIAIGVILSTLFGRTPERIGRLYFLDLLGAGIACAVVVFLIGWFGPVATIFLAAAALAGAALRLQFIDRTPPVRMAAVAVLSAALIVGVVHPSALPVQRLEASKAGRYGKKFSYTSWSPIFRVDVTASLPGNPDVRFLYHDGLIGSAIYRWDGNVASLSRYQFEHDVRALPFSIQPSPPGQELIIGAAGGHEILSSLWFHAARIDAVELNPATYSLVRGKFADYVGHVADYPGVNYVKADGRAYLARSSKRYDLIWYPAPDSYSATNASTSGAFVLSESYLYTTNAVADSLKHLAPGGIVATQFGEGNYNGKPNRTTRYVSVARQALRDRGITDPSSHIIVATSPQSLEIGGAALSTILVSNDPFTPAQVDRFTSALEGVPDSVLRYAPGHASTPNTVTQVATDTSSQLDRFYATYPYSVGPISDNTPFFWHFRSFNTVLRNFTHSISQNNASDREDTVGERVLLLLFLVATVLAAVFLLLPFVTIRRTWKALPRKGRSALYFGALGFGFIFFEITLIQRLVLFLGYPTYSLTVTLMSLLIFVGIGALISGRQKDRIRTLIPLLAVIIAAVSAFYLFALTPTTNALITLPLAVRVLIAFVVLAPLGVCLGMFMPLGLGAVAGLSEHGREYVAWSWAVNGFATVIGSVLSTILAMTFGFQVVLGLALGIYLVALASLYGLLPGGLPDNGQIAGGTELGEAPLVSASS